MNRLAISANNDLLEIEDSPVIKNGFILGVAKVISYVFHPLFIPVYLAWFLLLAQPWLFSAFSTGEKTLYLLRFFIMYSFFPMVTVLLSKALGFLDTIYLRTQKDRVIPYIACGIYYFWMAYVLRQQPDFSNEVVHLAIAIFISSSLGLIVNIYMKVSMHAIGMGIMLAFMASLSFEQSYGFTFYMCLAVFLAGLVCSARLILAHHNSKEMYMGLLVGLVSFLLAIAAHRILP